MKTEDEKKELEDHLKFYNENSINIIPINVGAKTPLMSWKTFQERKITSEEVDTFFWKTTHNLAAVCGSVSKNLFCIDCDTPEVFNAFFKHKEGLVYSKTGRGYHVFFRAEEPIKTLKCFNTTGQEVMTLKGDRSYFLLPPSIHPNGAKYQFIQKGKIPTLHGNVREDIKKRALSIGLNFGNAEKNEKIDIVTILLGVPEGARDTACTHIIHYLRRQGSAYTEAFKILQKWNAINKPPISENELYEKVNYHYNLPEPYSFFYLTNPAEYVITLDLELKPSIEINPPMNIEDVFYEDEKTGKPRIDEEKLIAFIDSYLTFICVSDTQELLHYEDGIYKPEMGILDVFLETHLGTKATIKFKSEIRKHIKDRNPINRSELNADKDFMPVKNGLLNLNTHELEPFSEDIIYTSGLPVTYDPAATAPEFLKFISEILPAEEVPVIREMCGYCFLRAYPAAKSFWLIGEGGNGKTILTSVLSALLGAYENVSHISLHEMNGRNRFAGYELYGKFANIIPEPSTTRALETPFLKAITGESLVSVEKKGVQQRVHFVNFAKILIEANNIPRIADEKQALWDRIIAIEFPFVFRGRKNERPEILKSLITSGSLSGILNWALEGLARLRANNWRFSNSIMQENIKTGMQIQSNPVAAFRDNWLSFSRDAEIPATVMYDAYALFSVLNGIEQLYKNVLSKELQTDNRVTLHRVRRDTQRPYVFQGCELSSKIICVYGWYNERPLKLGEFDDLEDSEKVEVRTCSLADYSLQYPEPVEEVQEIIGKQLVILNTSGLSELYKMQVKTGTVKHLGPQEIVYRKEDVDASKGNGAPLFINPISPLVEATCERCGKQAFLGYEVTDEEGVKSLVCGHCNKEIKEEIGKSMPPVFNTTLEERRMALKESEVKKEENKNE